MIRSPRHGRREAGHTSVIEQMWRERSGMSNQAFEELLQSPSLPTLPTVAVEILELTRDPNVNLKDIERLVQTDQGLASRVLRTVNSSLYGLREPCGSIGRALAYLGLNAVKSLVLGFSLVDVTDDVGEDVDSFDMNDYWRRVIYGAAGARMIALATRATDPDEAFTAAIFQDVGVLAGFLTIPEQYTPVLNEIGESHERLPDAERAALGFTHEQVGAALVKKWRMPEQFGPALEFHHRPDAAPTQARNLACIVYLGGLCADALSHESASGRVRECETLMLQWFGEPDEEMQRTLSHIADSASEFAHVIDKKIGRTMDVEDLMARAQEQQFEQTVMAHRENESLRESNETLAQASVTDGLTGIPNRKRFDRALEEHFALAQSEGFPFAVLLSDADRFKSVNDTHGHQAGDAVLVELASRMTQAVGERGLVCRYGGEEFVAILHNTTEDDAVAVAEAVRESIASTPFDLRGIEGTPDDLPVTVSIGVCLMHPAKRRDIERAEQVTAEADEALYAAKEGGRNQVRLAGRQGIATATAGQHDVSTPSEPVARLHTNGTVAAATAAAVPPRTAVASSSGHLVLLIEDDPLAATLIRAMLERVPNVEVEHVTTIMDARRRLSACVTSGAIRPSIVLCDYNLPDGQGTTVVGTIRGTSSLKDIPIVIATAASDPGQLESCLSSGADAVFSKNQMTADLQGWLRDLIRTYMPAA